VRLVEITAQVGDDLGPQETERVAFNYRSRPAANGVGLDGPAVLTEVRFATSIRRRREGSGTVALTGTVHDPVDEIPVVSLLRAELQRRGLTLIGGFCPVTLHDPARAAEQRRFALDVARRLRDLGAEVLVLAEAGDPARLAQAGHVVPGATPAFGADDWQRFAAAAGEIAARAQGLGLVSAFHPHVGSYVETEEETEHLLAETDPALVGLCVDTGHLAYGGADPVAITTRHRARVRHVHLKDIAAPVLDRARQQGWSFPEAVANGVFVPLGDGMVDLPAMLDALRQAGYAGWLVVEQDTRLLSPERRSWPLAHARRSRDALRRLGA
jgi:inosose dehydratase